LAPAWPAARYGIAPGAHQKINPLTGPYGLKSEGDLMRRTVSILAGFGVFAALLSRSIGVADETGAPAGPEFKAVAFGPDEAANIEKLARLSADGWDYVGPLNPGSVAFRKVVPKAVVGDAAKLSGVWINVYTEHDGIRETPESRHVFVDNRYFLIDGDRVAEDGTFEVDASGPVKKIDYKCVRGDYPGLTWHAVYELNGDTFRHFGPWGTDNWQNRPATLAAKTDATTFLRVLKRESP
jgi:uncharacterized protein (TIGR03067 family)